MHEQEIVVSDTNLKQHWPLLLLLVEPAIEASQSPTHPSNAIS